MRCAAYPEFRVEAAQLPHAVGTFGRNRGCSAITPPGHGGRVLYMITAGTLLDTQGRSLRAYDAGSAGHGFTLPLRSGGEQCAPSVQEMFAIPFGDTYLRRRHCPQKLRFLPAGRGTGCGHNPFPLLCRPFAVMGKG